MVVNIHIDVDNIWIYEKEYNVSSSNLQNLIYDESMPKMLDLLGKNDQKATFFIVGKDLELQSCKNFCKQAVYMGHEIANHTFSHAVSFYRLSYKEKEYEIKKCDEVISEITNEKVVGFRGPGYYIDDEIVEILVKNDYLYDSSVLPSFAIFMMKAFITLKARSTVDKAFGRKRWALASQKIQRLNYKNDPHKLFYEIPISTMPFLRLPIHSTFIYLLGRRYLSIAEKLMKRFSDRYTCLFHAIDLLDCSSNLLISKVPSLKWQYEDRLSLVSNMLDNLKEYEVLTSKDMINRLQICPKKSFILSSKMDPH